MVSFNGQSYIRKYLYIVIVYQQIPFRFRICFLLFFFLFLFSRAKQDFQVTVVVICYYFTYCYKCLISVELAAVAKHHHNDESIVDEVKVFSTLDFGNLVTRVYATENVTMRSEMLIKCKVAYAFFVVVFFVLVEAKVNKCRCRKTKKSIKLSEVYHFSLFLLRRRTTC
uniref:Transmembrane protein n=1 Tax=Glossina palpalis gambiensis TaxID=67801 RepID=A0A1B0AW44_9MUSC